MTGNLVLLGISVAGTRRPAGPNPVTVVIALAALSACSRPHSNEPEP